MVGVAGRVTRTGRPNRRPELDSPTQVPLRRLFQDVRTPFGLLLLLAPVVGVLQYRGIALAATLALAGTVATYARVRRRLPRPSGPTLAIALLIPAWCLVSAAWAEAPGRAAATALTVGGFVLLAALALRALREEPAERLASMLPLLAIGLGTGILLASLDAMTGGLLRAGVRGGGPIPGVLAFGLKPAVSVIALLLPAVLALPRVPRAARLALVLAGLATALLLPAESAKIAAVAGLLAMAGAALLGRWVARGIGVALAAAFVAMPLLIHAALPALPPLEGRPLSAAHRILIWDWAVDRVEERPVLGWGGEASRTVPGGRDAFDAATLDRFGLTSPATRGWFSGPGAQRLPLHTHNIPLQIWLELGGVGAFLAAALMLRLGWRAGENGPGATGMLAAAAVIGMLSYGVWQEWWIGLLLMAAIIGELLGVLHRGRAAPSSRLR